MCGISGLISLGANNKIEKSVKHRLPLMLSRIKHRGPDGYGIHNANDYAVGNVRLNILGGQQGKQPIKDKDNCLIFNGEIYNYKSLIEKYNKVNIFSDTFLLFELFKKYETKILQELNGMYAFCFINDSNIYLVRDKFGIKPLFYTITNNILYFASEIKAFYDFLEYKINISNEYRVLETEIDNKTIYKNIFQVRPGEYIKINRHSRYKIQKIYYRIKPKKLYGFTEKHLTKQLRNIVEDAIKIRVDTDLEYSVLASGGIDSSIIALLTKPKKIFTYLPKSNTTTDEEPYIDLLGSYLPNTSIIKIYGDYKNILNELIDIVYLNDGPTTTLSTIALYNLSKEINKHGIKILLSGLGADEFMNGYIRHAIVAVNPIHFKSIIFNQYKELINKAKFKKDFNQISNLYYCLLNRSGANSNIIKNNLIKICQSNEMLASLSLADLQFTLPPLIHTEDHLSMSFGIENRNPFMDYKFIEFALGIPHEYKLNINRKNNIVVTKYLLRSAFKDILPEEIYNRHEKVGFTSNISEIIRQDMKYIFRISYDILKNVHQNQDYLIPPKNSNDIFSRWDYQICQLALSYLIYEMKLSKNEILLYYENQKNTS